jgi:hypothetical protein
MTKLNCSLKDYQINCDNSETKIFKFHTLSKDLEKPPTSLIIGDLGYLGGHSFEALKRDVKSGVGNVLIHVGKSSVKQDFLLLSLSLNVN